MRSAGARPGPAAQITAPTVAQLPGHLRRRQRGPPARDRLHLVERAAGVAEAAARQLRHGRAARRHERAQHERHLVAHAPGRVLVDGRSAHAREVEALAAGDHGIGPRRQLGRRQAPEEDRHEQRRRLLVGDLAAGVGVDEPVDLLVGELAAVALGADDLDGVHGSTRRVVTWLVLLRQGRAGTPGRAASGLGAAHHLRLVEGAGQQLAHRTRRAVAVDEAVRPAVLPQQLPAPAAGHHRLAVAGHGDDGDEPAAAASRASADTSPHSAHRSSPYEAFSTLQPAHDPSVVGEPGGADVEVRVRRVGVASAASTAASRSASQSIGRHSDRPCATAGRPQAGGRSRCDENASTSSVTRYGVMNTSWLFTVSVME